MPFSFAPPPATPNAPKMSGKIIADPHAAVMGLQAAMVAAERAEASKASAAAPALPAAAPATPSLASESAAPVPPTHSTSAASAAPLSAASAAAPAPSDARGVGFCTFNRGLGSGSGGPFEFLNAHTRPLAEAVRAAGAGGGGTLLELPDSCLQAVLDAYPPGAADTEGLLGADALASQMRSLTHEIVVGGKSAADPTKPADLKQIKVIKTAGAADRYIAAHVPSWTGAQRPPLHAMSPLEYFRNYCEAAKSNLPASVLQKCVKRYKMTPAAIMYGEAGLGWAFHCLVVRALGYEHACALFKKIQKLNAEADPAACARGELEMISRLGMRGITVPECSPAKLAAFLKILKDEDPRWESYAHPAANSDEVVTFTALFARDLRVSDAVPLTAALGAAASSSAPAGARPLAETPERVWAAKVSGPGLPPAIYVASHGQSDGSQAACILSAAKSLQSMMDLPCVHAGDTNARGTPDVRDVIDSWGPAGGTMTLDGEKTCDKTRVLTFQPAKPLARDTHHKDQIAYFGACRLVHAYRMYAGAVLAPGAGPCTPQPGYGDHYTSIAFIAFD
jgi:hypothetical protein